MLTSLRTLLVGREGLDHAKSLIAGYKQGKIRDMNAELWSAKKIVDSTLHPGMSSDCGGIEYYINIYRHWRASIPPFSNVVLCLVELGGYSRNANAWSGSECSKSLPVGSMS
jgi:hypothetical protein